MTLVLIWLLQDILQVLATETFIVPDLFLLGLVSFGASRRLEPQSLLWSAFAGGLLWDARWTGLLGFSALLYVAAIWLFLSLWGRIPQAGRSPILLGFVALGLHLAVGLGHFFSWGYAATEPLFVNQQILALPVVVLVGWWGCRGEKDGA